MMRAYLGFPVLSGNITEKFICDVVLAGKDKIAFTVSDDASSPELAICIVEL